MSFVTSLAELAEASSSLLHAPDSPAPAAAPPQAAPSASATCSAAATEPSSAAAHNVATAAAAFSSANQQPLIPELQQGSRPFHNKRQRLSRDGVASPSRTSRKSSLGFDDLGDKESRKKQCHCRNSRCLKLYCECFASQVYCSGCSCLNCLNTPANENGVIKAINSTLERNPSAFRPKIDASPARYEGVDGAMIVRHCKGCHCVKSHCLKKYCECFQAGIVCGDLCKCKDCKNTDSATQLGSNSPTGVLTIPHSVSVTSARSSLSCPASFETTAQQPAQAPSAHTEQPVLWSSPGVSLSSPAATRVSVSLTDYITQPVLAELCRVLLLSTNELNASKATNAAEPLKPLEIGEEGSAQKSSTTPTSSTLLCHEDPVNITPTSPATVLFQAQEEAVLRELTAFLRGALEMAHSRGQQVHLSHQEQHPQQKQLAERELQQQHQNQQQQQHQNQQQPQQQQPKQSQPEQELRQLCQKTEVLSYKQSLSDDRIPFQQEQRKGCAEDVLPHAFLSQPLNQPNKKHLQVRPNTCQEISGMAQLTSPSKTSAS